MLEVAIPIPERLMDDAIGGAKQGLKIALVFCLWVTVVHMVGGSEAFERKHVSYLAVITTYVGIGLVAGAIVGTLRKHVRSRISAYLVGLCAGVPISIALLIAVYGAPQRWRESYKVFLPVYSMAAAYVIGSELDRKRRENAGVPVPGEP